MLSAIDGDAAIVADAEDAPPCDLLSIIGETRRAITFLGEQRWPVRRLVAFKLLKVEACPEAVIARAMHPALTHPAVAPLLEGGYIGGRPYLMTPFLGGGPLRIRYARPAITMSQRIQALLALTDVLVIAHGRGLAHGRLTASNVLCETGALPAVRILDFDCNARKIEGDDSTEDLVRDDVEGLLTLADALGLPGLDRLRRAGVSTLDLRRQFERL